MRDESLKYTKIKLIDEDKKQLLNTVYEEVMEKVANGFVDNLDEFVKYVMYETGFSKECAIKYINKFFTFVYDVRTDYDVVNKCYQGVIDIKPEWKPAEQVLEEGIELGRECEKLLLEDRNIKI